MKSTDTSVVKLDSRTAPHGPEGQRYLASGLHVAMRLWEVEPKDDVEPRQRDYETVGYVLQGRADLDIEGQIVHLEPGDSWMVPKGAEHTYRILEKFVAVEATSPPAFAHARDEC